MTWTLSVGPVEQGEVRDALEEARAAADEAQGFGDGVLDQQDAVFAAAETVVDKAEFSGRRVRVNAAGHVHSESDAETYVSLSVYAEPEG